MDNQVIIEIPQEFRRLFDTDWREAAVYGGRFSLKSHTVARILLIRARMSKIRVACFREFQSSIAESSHQLLADLIKKYELTDFQVTDKSIINTINGSDFIFKGLYNNEQSIKSIEGINLAWVEEAQTISKSSLEVLTPTVREDGSQIIYTYNRLLEIDPIHKRLVMEGRPNTLIINVNYDIALKYGMMPETIRLEMEDDKAKRTALYKHKWLGEPNTVEGRIYTDWQIIDEIPHEARLWRRGLDFGYTIDPTVLEDIYEWNGGYIIDESLYKKGLSNKSIADHILNQKEQCLVIADSAEPKSIDELASYGVQIVGCQKGAGSVNQGIQFVANQKISITRKSLKTITAYQNYTWETDKRTTEHLPVPDDSIHEWSNSMDAIRYGFNGSGGNSRALEQQKRQFELNKHKILSNSSK
jgi:phage terminase large subunit